MRADWLSFEEGRERILGRAKTLGSTELPLADAVGMALAAQVSATATLPPFDNSAMDGYALRAADFASAGPEAPSVVKVIGRVGAGGRWSGPPVGVGEAIRVMTGAPVPPGADSVVRVEDTAAVGADVEGKWVEAGNYVHVLSSRDAGRHVRPRGEDVHEGEVVLRPGEPITPGVVALAAAMGLGFLPVVKPPRVAIIVTGDELRPPDRFADVVAGVGVPDSNSPMLVAQALTAGASIHSCVRVGDDREELEAAFEAARSADALVVSGGASMGDADLVKSVLDRLGFELDFWRLRMRPGSPVGFGFLGELPVFSLPGNPSSAFVTFELLARPFLLARGGHRQTLARTVSAVAADRLAGPARVTSFFRVLLQDGSATRVAKLSGPQGSGLVSSLAAADGLAILPDGLSELMPGERVDVVPLGRVGVA